MRRRNSPASPPLKIAVTVRIEPETVCRLDAIATDTGLCRSNVLLAMVIHCIEAVERGELRIKPAQVFVTKT